MRHSDRLIDIQVKDIRLFRTHYASFKMLITYTNDEGDTTTTTLPCRVGIKNLTDLVDTINKEVIYEVANRASGKS